MKIESNDPIMAAMRFQLAAVKQHFIHVLILQSRNDNNSAAQITKIDSVDLPSAMQLVDLLVRAKTEFDLCSNTTELLQTFPRPGFSNTEIRQSEQLLETNISNALSIAMSATQSANTQIHDLTVQSFKLRSDYSNWLRTWSEKMEPDYVTCSPLKDDQSQWLDCLFANMMVMIDQTMIHSLVQYRSGNDRLADLTWEVSGAAMMQATAITNHLAKRGLAANPMRTISTELRIAMHSTTTDPINAIQLDKKLAAHCVEIGSAGKHVLSGTEFEQIADRLTSYFDAVVNWSKGETLPNIPNPCRDFGRTRSLYLDPNALSRTA